MPVGREGSRPAGEGDSHTARTHITEESDSGIACAEQRGHTNCKDQSSGGSDCNAPNVSPEGNGGRVCRLREESQKGLLADPSPDRAGRASRSETFLPLGNPPCFL
jgi:hypothetical protein